MAARGRHGRALRRGFTLLAIALIVGAFGLRLLPPLTAGLPRVFGFPPGGVTAFDLALPALLVLGALLREQRVRVQGLREEVADRESKSRSIHLELAELSSIFEVSSRVNSFLDLEEALVFIAHCARECLTADRVSLMIREGEELVLRAAAGADTRELEGARVRMGEAVAGWVALHRRPLLLDSRRDLEAFYPGGQPKRGISSALCVPLTLKGETVGVLNVNRLEGREKYEERHLKLLTIFADYAASAIHHLRMYGEISEAHARLEQSYRETKEIQDQLVHSEKMSTIGQLISEVAHELNNPLTTTVGYSQLLSRVNRDPEMAEYLETIRSEGVRCQRIIENLLDFARKNRGEKCVVDVNLLIGKTLDLRRYQLRIAGIELEARCDGDVPGFLADPNRLQQVFLNLLNNAAQAMEAEGKPGKVTFTTSYSAAEGTVAIRVSDTGPGIPPGLTRRIFEPFFTTKPAGKGTGLGLSICRGIVEELGGAISVEAGSPRGAEFTITLPVAEQTSPPVEREREEPAPPSGKHILVVDDDDRICDLLCRALELDDHLVATAGSAEEALDAAAGTEFDLVLSDLLMPGGTGLDLYRRFEAQHPRLGDRFVFLTGAVALGEQEGRIRETGRPLLHKPFRMEDLRQVIRRVLAPGTGPENETGRPPEGAAGRSPRVA